MDHLKISDLVDLNQNSFYISLAAIAFNPTWWNIVARNGDVPLIIFFFPAKPQS